MYFNDFTTKIMQQTPRSQIPGVKVDLESFNSNTFKNGIQSAYSTMDTNNLSIFIKNNIDEIIKDIQSGRIPYIRFFGDTKFVDAFTISISSIPISYEVRYACNRLAYDYFTSDNPAPDIKQKYLNISRIVNKVDIAKLLTLGLDENTASNLALCRYSSPDESVNIKRLNFTIYFKSPDVMTEQMIVYIYEKLFDRITEVFVTTMLETYSDEQERAYGDGFIEVYGNVSLAVLDIVNNMTTEQIKTILCKYQSALNSSRSLPRFSLRCLSKDHDRIRRVVESLAINNNVYIP